MALAALLFARAIENTSGLAAALRGGRSVIVVGTRDPQLVAPALEVLETCVFDPPTKIRAEGDFLADISGGVVLFGRNGRKKGHSPDSGNERVADLVHGGATLIGIAPEPRSHLPRDLIRICDFELTLPHADASALAFVIEAVTGQTANIEEAIAGQIELGDLPLAIRPGTTATASVERLRRLVADKNALTREVPRLETLHGFGGAMIWARNFVTDLRQLRSTGRVDWWQLMGSTSLLLSGPPGTGKTTFCQAVAASAGIAIVQTSVAEWFSHPYLSGTLNAIKDCIARAKKCAPSLLFVDEASGLGDRARLVNADYGPFYSQVIALVLESLTELRVHPVAVIFACNDRDHLDPAIRRAGRLDTAVELALPDFRSLVQIFESYLGRDVLTQAELTSAASLAVGRTGADVQAWVKRARATARRAGRAVCLVDVTDEIKAVRPPLPRWLRRNCAVHESGHLVVGVALRMFEPRNLSITDEGGMASVETGYAPQTLAEIENSIVAALGGRAAEVVLLGEKMATAGAGVDDERRRSDLSLATDAALNIELAYGMGEMGLMRFSDRSATAMMHDPRIARLVRDRLDRCFGRAKKLVAANAGAIRALAVELEAAGYLDNAAIAAVLEKHQIEGDV
ncbi:AAA family ATPase [Bradyrhizobium sp. CCBAU 11434]|uniref:AAA family ATPase n=1 Tax=Bradyrhizobium sp. CCBAU 11434 TaxID=1630885 RepID=UPI002304EDE7|nr:AAA family ATPase [Bradyrhizobium sp. CCBAU 11434]